VAVYDYEDSPMALLQLMNDLEKVGFHADFKLHEGLEIRIRKTRKPVVNNFVRVR
jgi:hypothetical protein